MKESTRQIADRFECNYTVFEKGSAPEPLEQAYRAAYHAGKTGGFFPAIVLLDEHMIEWLDYMNDENYNRDELIAGCKDNGKAILQERFEGYMEDFEVEDLDDFIGDETEGEVVSHFISYLSFCDNKLEDDVLLLEVPVQNPWEIIAYLPMGGWNDCPAPEEMIAVCKYWYEKYQAVPAAFTSDMLEFYAPARLNGVDSLEAAREHYAFCTDRVEQGTQTYKVSELAAGLKESDVWYFWWD